MALPTLPSYWQDKFQHLEAQRYRMRKQQQKLHEHRAANAKFFQDNNLWTHVQNNFMSNRSYNKSMNAFASRDKKCKRQASLQFRRQKLGKLLQQESQQYEIELKKLSSHTKSGFEKMKERTNALKTAREEKRKKVAENLLYEHWKENNPDLRDIARNLHQKDVSETWTQQQQLKKEKLAEKVLEEKELAEEYEIARKEAVEDVRRKEKEKLKEEKARMQILKQQMNEIKLKEEEALALREEDAELQKERWKLQKMQEERDDLEKKRKNSQLQRFLHHQYKAQLRRKAQQVQEELELDKMILEKLQEEERRRDEIETARQEGAKEDIKWMKEVLEEQMRLEKKRELELDLIYREEARRMWSKREEEWRREREARKKLMNEVLSERSKQMEERAETIQKEQKRLLEEREELLEELDEVKKTSRLNKEKEKKMKSERNLELLALINEQKKVKQNAKDDHEKQLKQKQDEENHFKELFEDEKDLMEQRGHIDKVYTKVRRAWE